jgi:OOP family OmpA-OmpF porin
MKKYIYYLIISFFTSSALAEGYYAGIGYLKSDINTYKYPSETYSAYDDEDNGITLFAGYDFNERFGIEAGYNDLGESTGTITTPLSHIKEIKVLTLAGVLKTNSINNFIFLAKAGIAEIENDEALSNGRNFNKKTTNAYYGLGSEYTFSGNLVIRALYEDYGQDDGTTSGASDPDQIDPTAMSLSLIKRF